MLRLVSKMLVLSVLLNLLPLGLYANADSADITNITRELGLTLSKSDQRKVDKAVQLMQVANQLLETSKNGTDESGSKKAFQESSDRAFGALNLVRGVYNNALDAFYKKASPIYINKFDHARYYDQHAEGYIDDASRVLRKLDSVNDIKNYYAVYANSYENVKWAIINQLRSIKIYQDFPLEYPYEWDDFFRQHQIMLAREEAAKYAAHPETKKQEQTEAKESFKVIYFRVQIAAHTLKIPAEELRKIYKGNLLVQELNEDGWYKYSIGNFERYDQALELLKSCQVRKAFIVAYDTNNIRQDLKSLKK